jgi:hypothetical protein
MLEEFRYLVVYVGDGNTGSRRHRVGGRNGGRRDERGHERGGVER